MTWPQAVILRAGVVPPFSTGGLDVTAPALVRLGLVVGDTADISGPSDAAEPADVGSGPRHGALAHCVVVPPGCCVVGVSRRPADGRRLALRRVRVGAGVPDPGVPAVCVLDNAVETSRVTKHG